MGGGRAYDGGGEDVLGEEETLGLDDEEVDELVEIARHGVERVLGQDVVLLRADLRDEAGVEEGLADDLSQDGHAESPPGDLQGVAQEVEVSGGEDEDDDGDVGDGGDARVLPAEEAREEVVVVCQGLSRRGLGRWPLAGVGEVGELIRRLRSLVLDVVGDGSWERGTVLAMTS